MPTGSERFQRIALKVKRAAHHLDQLEANVRNFVGQNPYEVQARVENGGVTYFVASVKSVPDDIALAAGDVIQCLVTALDHLAYQIVCTDTNDAPPAPSQIYFPISNSHKEYDKEKRKRLRGAAAESIAALDLLKPYKGGNDKLWALHQLNRIEKHRTLLTIGSRLLGTDISQHMIESHAKIPGIKPEAIEAMRNFLSRPVVIFDKGDELIPVHVGQILFRDQASLTPSDVWKFQFGVALDESGVFWHQDIVVALREFLVAVMDAISGMRARLG